MIGQKVSISYPNRDQTQTAKGRIVGVGYPLVKVDLHDPPVIGPDGLKAGTVYRRLNSTEITLLNGHADPTT